MPNYLTSIKDYSTTELVEEILKRKGVDRMTVAPHSEFAITIDENWEGVKDACEGEGSAVVLIVTD